MWTYYRQDYPNGFWFLFREDEGRHEQVYHRQDGWMKTNELMLREAKGEITEGDRVSEQEAFDLIRSIGADPDRHAPVTSGGGP